jgi:hypothetical protein
VANKACCGVIDSRHLQTQLTFGLFLFSVGIGRLTAAGAAHVEPDQHGAWSGGATQRLDASGYDRLYNSYGGPRFGPVARYLRRSPTEMRFPPSQRSGVQALWGLAAEIGSMRIVSSERPDCPS